MKRFFGERKGLRALSLLLACCLLATTIGPNYVKAQGLQASDFGGTSVEVSDDTNGVKVTYPNAAEWYQRAVTNNTYSTEQGIHVEIKDISIPDNADYSFAIAMGNGNPMTGDYNHWSDKAGYMLVYGNGGHFEIFPTAGYNTAPMANANTKLVSVEREALSGSITMDLKLVDDSYVITVNDATYTIPAVYTDVSKAIVDTKNLYLAFGVLGGTDANTGNPKWETALAAGTSFVIAELSNNYQAPVIDEQEWDETKLFKAEQMTYNADSHYDVADIEGKGTQITHSASTAFYARVNSATTYSAEKGIQLEVSDIACPSDSDYSIAISIGNTADQWYDKTGYMIVYGSAGNFSIVATGAGGNITTGAVVASFVREPLVNALSMNIKLTGNDYVITVNGDIYTIPATHKNYPLGDTKNLYLGVGMLDGGIVNELDLLKTFEDGTFTIKYMTDELFEAMKEEFGYERTKNVLLEETTEGVKVVYTSDSILNEDFVQKVDALDVSQGVHLEIKNMTAEAENYSLAVAFGNAAKQWANDFGYMLVYEKGGQFKIFTTPHSEGTEFVSIKRESLTDTFVLDMKLVESNYVITVNGDTYTLPNVAQETVANQRFALGILEGGSASFVIEELSDAYNAPTIEKVDSEEATIFTEEEAFYKDEYAYQVEEKSGTGTKFTHTMNTVFYARATTKLTRNTKDGIHIELKDIASPSDEDYSIAVSLGNSSDQWYDKTGYMLVYGKDGNFSIVATSGAQNTHIQHGEIMVSVVREPLEGVLTVDVKLQNNDYVITVNGDVYVIPAAYNQYPIGNVEELYVGIGMLDGGKVAELDLVKQLTDATFTISKVYSKVVSSEGDQDDETVDDRNSVPPEGMGVEGTSFRFEETKEGLVITHVADGAAWERVYYKNAYSVKDEGVKLNIGNIVSDAENYSLVIGIGGNAPVWYDKQGCMILYGKSGNLSIIAPSGKVSEENKIENPNDAKVLASKKVDEYKDTLLLNVKKQGDNYLFVINGEEFVVGSEYLGNSEQIFLSLGIMSDYTLRDGDISDLKYFESDFKDKDVSFTVVSLTGQSIGDGTTGEEIVDNRNKIPPEGMGVEGTSFRFEESKEGIVITHIADGAAWERVYYHNAYLVEDEGVKLEIENIVSEAENYSLVIGVGGNGPIWYDRQGVMILYGKSGNLSLIAPSGIVPEGSVAENPNDAKVLASKKFDKSKNALSLTVKMQEDNYLFVINGEEFVVSGKYLGNSEQIFLSLGIMSDYTLKNGDISGLKYFESDFKDSDVSFTVTSLIAQGVGEEVIEGNVITPDEAGMTVTTDNLILHKVEKGVKVIHTAQAGAWERVAYKNAFSPLGSGIHIGIEDITSKAKNYSLAVKLGSTGSWYDTRGYMIIYGKSGNFSIVATDSTITNPNTSPVLVSEVREALGESFVLDVKLKGTNYQITVNGKTYTVPAQHKDYPIENPKELYLAFGIMSDGKLGDIDYFGNTFKRHYVSFVLADVSGTLSFDDPGKPFGMFTSGYNWELSKAKNGVKVTQGIDGTSWERVSLNDPYETTEGGLQIELSDIASADPNYSVVIAIGNDKGPWYDTTGYMIIYGKSGNFAIIATDSTIINPNNSPVVVSEVRETLGKTLSVNIRLMDDGENYAITVNGKLYTIPAEHEDFALEYTDIVYVSFGIMSDGEIGNLIYNKEYKKGETSFTVTSVYHSKEDVVDEITPEKPKEEKPQEVEKEEPKETVQDEKTVNVAGILVGGVSTAILLVLIIVIAVLRIKKKRVGGEE